MAVDSMGLDVECIYVARGETRLFEALNQYEIIVLKMVHCFEAFDTVKMATSAGQLLVLHLYG